MQLRQMAVLELTGNLVLFAGANLMQCVRMWVVKNSWVQGWTVVCVLGRYMGDAVCVGVGKLESRLIEGME